MNLSVRRNKTRRGPRGAVGDFGLPIRVKMTLPSVKEPGDDLDGITELDTTVDEPQQGCKPEMASSTQGTHSTDGSMRTTSSTSKKDIETVQKPPTGTSHSATHNQAQSKENGTRENLFMLQTADSVVSNQRQNSSIQDVSQSITANPPSATLNNSRSHHKNSSQQQPETWSSQQRKFQAQQVPGPQTLTAPSANSVTGGSSTIRRENSSSITPVVNNSGSFLQHHTPFSHSGQLLANPGQLPGVGFTPGYPPEMQFINPVVSVASQVPQGTIVVNGKSYQKLSTIGKGGSSKVCSLKNNKKILNGKTRIVARREYTAFLSLAPRNQIFSSPIVFWPCQYVAQSWFSPNSSFLEYCKGTFCLKSKVFHKKLQVIEPFCAKYDSSY